MDKPESNVPLSESWSEGQPPPGMGTIIAVSEARKELKGWSEQQIRSTAKALHVIFDAWEQESGEREGLLGHLILSDSIDLFLRLLSEKGFQPVLEHFSVAQGIAVLVLEETANGNSYAALKGSAVLLKIKNETLDAVGDIYERTWFPHIRRGVKTLASAKKAHAMVHGTEREKEERWSAYQAELEKAHREHPRWGMTTLHQHVAAKFRVSSKTIQRRTKKTW